MSKITAKKRHTLRRSKQSKLYSGLEKQIGTSASLFKTESIEMLETTSDFTLYLINKKPLLMGYKDMWTFPTLRGAVEIPFPERRIVVDSGAVPFMAKGADVMRPGIVSVSDDIKKDLPVVIVEERYKKPLAIAIALYNAEEILNLKTGKAAKNIHSVGDEIWNLEI
ncbi:MAG: RNA-binding protein [Euryarchaeota archaeon]|nr:RNA-binding protein [Euryarchaeota archaeon]